ncbi:UDP-N-acetylmuramoyl-L-alanyl-D-glutamate--2,6-diaminopimelate ligase [Patescibacteria group bacterium]|nr:UDP-N-acetylmuramoyl-L-alanyl-D-glutamate--2,6-diaminopimelate ligase [Patescibacteria group bacterium]
MKSLIRKITPKFIIQAYHRTLAFLGAFFYGNPSQKMIVIGVTGTNGKSTSSNLIAKVLEGAGYKVGLCSTFNFKIGNEEWANDTKITMPGRFRLQKYLKKMADVGCQYAVVETSSEGIEQFRHKNINYDVAVFTNLTPEHIESHGSFENYKHAKGMLFQSFGAKKKFNGKDAKKISIANIDDEHAEFFLSFPADEKWGFGKTGESARFKSNKEKLRNIVEAKDTQTDSSGVKFYVNGTCFQLKLLGKFNISNALSAITVGLSQSIDIEKIKEALEKVTQIPGRMELVKTNRNFVVIVDYAHEPAGLEQVYKTVSPFPHNKLISVLGSQGGGRDKRKRPVLGRLAGSYTDYVIVTNEDPYDDDPMEIINEVAAGTLEIDGKELGKNVWKILERKEGVEKALSLANEGDIVVITGKGAEQNMVIENGKKVPWDDRRTVREILNGSKHGC